MKKQIVLLLVSLLYVGNWCFGQEAVATESQLVPTAAVLNFEARSRQASNDQVGKSVGELLFVKLLESGCVDLVERAELNKALDELHLSAVGMTSQDSQLKLGQLIGAKILITGSIFEASGKRYAVAKIIGTETSRVKGCSVSGMGDYVELVPSLAEKIQAVLENDVAKLLPRKATVFSIADKLADIKGNGRKVYLDVKENVQQNTPDPASDIALKKILLALDFQIVKVRNEADFAIVCEAVASNAGQYHKFSSAQARVELSVYQVKGEKLLATGARKETMAGATYIIAAKDAINQATLVLAGKVLQSLK